MGEHFHETAGRGRAPRHHSWGGMLEFLKIPAKSRGVISSRAVAVIFMSYQNGAKSQGLKSVLSLDQCFHFK
eukprot:719168-Prymnesium_polylepis.1